MKKQLMTLMVPLALLIGCGGAEFSSANTPHPGAAGSGAILNDTPPPTTGGSSGTSSAGTGGSTSGSGGTSGTTSNSESSSAPPKCIPGSTTMCSCLTDHLLQGMTTCNVDGAYEPCKCPEDSKPSGSGGSAGSSAGASGTGGANDTSSTGGSSGTSSTGTGGSTSGSGGSTSTGGTSSNAGTSGSGGSPPMANTQSCTFVFTSPNDAFASDFGMTFVQDKGQNQNASCTGSGTTRTCTMTVDRTIGTEFWLYTGLTNPGPGAPGWVDTSSNEQAIVKLVGKCTGGEDPVPIRMTTHFRIEPKGSNLQTEDWDGDRVPTSADCDDTNPSIGSECNGTGGVSSSGLTTVAFYGIGADWNTSPLQLLPTNGAAVACQSVNTTDPANANASAMAVRCFIDIDLTKEFAFNVQSGVHYAAASPTPGTCQPYFRIYAYVENQYALGDLDNVSTTAFPYQMFIRPRGQNCDVVLPAP